MQRPEKLKLLTEALRKVRDNYKPKMWYDATIDKMRIEKGHEKPFIARYDLRQLITRVLGITDTHTIHNWINLLIGKQILQQNPHTHLTKRGIIKPSNNTRYFILTKSIQKQTAL